MGPLFLLSWGRGHLDTVIEQARLTPCSGNYKEMTGLERSAGVLQDLRLLILLLRNPPYTLSPALSCLIVPFLCLLLKARAPSGLTLCLPESLCTLPAVSGAPAT